MKERELEPDIIRRIHTDFKDEDLNEALTILIYQYNNVGIVGRAQFVRCLIFLSKGDLIFLKKYISKMDDPRDVVMDAEKHAGNPGHYFGITFEEIDEFKYEFSEFNDWEKGEIANWESLYQAEKEFEEYQKEQNTYWDFFFQTEKDFDDYT